MSQNGQIEDYKMLSNWFKFIQQTKVTNLQGSSPDTN